MADSVLNQTFVLSTFFWLSLPGYNGSPRSLALNLCDFQLSELWFRWCIWFSRGASILVGVNKRNVACSAFQKKFNQRFLPQSQRNQHNHRNHSSDYCIPAAKEPLRSFTNRKDLIWIVAEIISWTYFYRTSCRICFVYRSC